LLGNDNSQGIALRKLVNFSEQRCQAIWKSLKDSLSILFRWYRELINEEQII
jgi:hypothetical protein